VTVVVAVAVAVVVAVSGDLPVGEVVLGALAVAVVVVVRRAVGVLGCHARHGQGQEGQPGDRPSRGGPQRRRESGAGEVGAGQQHGEAAGDGGDGVLGPHRLTVR
jgi:hypothetical protein